jgi:hypothetical protein
MMGFAVHWPAGSIRGATTPGVGGHDLPPTLGAVAAARVHETASLDGYRLIDCRPLRGDAGLSTDERHMWLAAFEHTTRGEILAVFMSPTGILLGQVVIPQVVHDDGTHYTWRTPEEISTIFRERNHWG